MMASGAMSASEALVDRFIERATAAGVEVVRVSTDASLAAQVLARVIATGIRSVIMWDDDLLRPIVDALRSAGVAITDDPASAGAGITTADFAISETGTLVLSAGPGRPRATSLLPPLHVAVLPEDRIVGTLSDLMPHLEALPSALAFVTGPSRTADIELTPVRGAHGPVNVAVYLLPDALGRAPA